MGSRTRRSRIDDLLAQQGRALDRLHDAQAASVLAAYEDARRSLHERLTHAPASSETQQRLRVMLAQVNAGAVDLRERLGQALSAGERKAHDTAQRHLLKLVKTAEPGFLEVGGAVEVGVVQRLAALRGLALHQYAVDRYGAQVVDAIQRELAAGVASGLTVQQLADRVAAAGGSVMAGMRGRCELIARMETSRAYNDAHLEAIREIEAQDPRPDDPILKKIDEFIDGRNHPFSRAANGRTALPGDVFVVPIAAVRGAAKASGRKTSVGILWKLDGRGNWVGQTLPAHYHERGRIIPWRASWGPSVDSPPPPRKKVAAPEPAPEPPPPVVAPLAVVPTPPPPTLRELEDEIRGFSEEHGVTVLSDGTVLRTDPEYSRDCGIRDPRKAIMVPPEHLRAAKADGNAVFSHNHPSGGPHSPTDIQMAAHTNLREVRATRRDGSTWSVKRPPNGWPNHEELREQLDDARDRARKSAMLRMDQRVLDAGGDPRDDEEAPGFDRTLLRQFGQEAYVAELREALDAAGLRLELEP